MHIVAWLLTQRAVETGEIPKRDGRRPERRLGHAQDSDPEMVAQLPEPAQAPDRGQRRPLCADPADRRGRLAEEPAPSPARALMGRLERGLGGNLA